MVLDLLCTVFQSTLPRRERRTKTGNSFKVYHFNPRSREGSDVTVRKKKWNLYIFQSTLPRRERLIPSGFMSFASTFQSTLPRRERPSLTLICPVLFIISIHAPAKGATNESKSCGNDIKISIHAPAKGATRRTKSYIAQNLFQSTLPRRERPAGFVYLYKTNDISIHAPAKGATRHSPRISGSRPYFNPRSREGSDGVYFVTQATSEKISIHAPAKGATSVP